MPRTVTITLQDGSQHTYQNVPDNVTPDQVNARASSEFGQGVANIDGGRNGAPASTAPQHAQQPDNLPRWDVLGDIGRAASGSATALGNDLSTAFPNTKTMDFGPVATVQRMGSALKAPLDVLGVVASPVTGAIHGLLGSGLSYVLPTPGKDTTGPGGTTFYSDPKKAADQIIDSSLSMAGPRGLGSPATLSTAMSDARAANAARSATKLKNKAADIVNRRAVEDGLTAQQIADAQQAASASGDKLTIMDLGDQNVRGLAGSIYRAPGPARKEMSDFLSARNEAVAPTITKDIGGALGNGSTYETTQSLLDARSAAARPAYNAVESIGPVHSDRLQMFLDTPEVQEGLRRGLKLERQNAIAENRPFVDSDYAVTGYKDGNLDMPIFGKVPTMKSMIVANEGLGAQIEGMVNPATGRLTKDGLALKNFRNAFQAELDSLSGGKYAAARDVWSGPAQSMEAVRNGREHFSSIDSNAQLKAEFDKLSPGDKDFYRMGAAEAKIDQMERAPDASDASKKIINSERDRKRFRILFGSDAEAEQFIQNVARKRQMFDTKTSVTGNSATAGRLAEDENLNLSAGFHGVNGLLQGASGNILGAAQSFLRAKRDLGLRNNPALNLEISRILTSDQLPTVPNQPGRILPTLPLPKKQSSIPSAAFLGAVLNAPGASGSPYNKR